jgi:Fe-S-cluster containining protein
MKEQTTWYDEGLQFKCTGCGACCGGSPGYVFLTEEDEKNIAEELNISISAFQKKYTCIFLGKRSLIEAKENHDCIFLKNKQCSIYHSRPKQCRTYPFWSGIMQKKEHWIEEKQYCEGIDRKDGNFYSKEQIEKILLEKSSTKPGQFE